MSKRFVVCISVDASITIEVDAENEEQAKELAMERVYVPGLCHQCAHQIEIGEPIEALEAWESNEG